MLGVHCEALGERRSRGASGNDLNSQQHSDQRHKPEATMALSIQHGAPSILIRRQAYEASGLSRATIDERLGLTADEFRVEAGLVVLGPIFGGADDALTDVIAELERLGLRYFDDFFELSGNWPAWLSVLTSSA